MSRLNWKCIPRGVRLLLNIILIAVITMLHYIFIDCPAFSAEDQFRREEKANFVGPSNIIDTISVENYSYLYPYDKLLIADSYEGVTLFCYDGENLDKNEFTYRDKMGEITVLSVPSKVGGGFETKYCAAIPIIVFDNIPNAVRAELEIELSAVYGDSVFSKVYLLEASREKEGYFLFCLSVSSSSKLGGEGAAIDMLPQISDDDPFSANANVAFPATVYLYDGSGTLLSEYSTVIRSPAGQAHAQQSRE